MICPGCGTVTQADAVPRATIAHLEDRCDVDWDPDVWWCNPCLERHIKELRK